MTLGASVDYTHFQETQHSEQDATLMVRFFNKEVHDKKASDEKGMTILKTVEYVEIRIPGERDPRACRPARYDDKQRFAKHYEAFKQRTQMPTDGFPIREWAQTTATMAEHLEFMNIKTVEQLANASDTNVSKIMGGLTLKAKAQQFVEDRNNPKNLAEENRALEKRLADLEALMAQQGETKIDSMAEVDEPLAEVEPEEQSSKPRRSRKRAE